MKTLKIFVAGSKNLSQERDLFNLVAHELQTKFGGRGHRSIYIEVVSFENFSKFFGKHRKGVQDDYNNYIVKEADAVFFVLDDSIGGVTREEFDLAYEAFKASERPKICVFSRRSNCENEDIAEIRGLCNDVKQYYNEYVDYVDLRRLISRSIEDLCSMKIDGTLHKRKRRNLAALKIATLSLLAVAAVSILSIYGWNKFQEYEEKKEVALVLDEATKLVLEDVELDAREYSNCGNLPSGGKRYRVGDYYDVDGKQGVVFVVSSDGRHGRIVSLDRSEELCWAVDSLAQISSNTKHQSDGMENQRIIEQNADWQSKYPAFAWCANKGDGWYLPSINELRVMTMNQGVYDAVNKTLLDVGGTPFYDERMIKRLYSSTEGNICVWSMYMYNRCSYLNNKYHTFCVRAVAAF